MRCTEFKVLFPVLKKVNQICLGFSISRQAKHDI